ncbi:MAG TPA: Rieske (2Fe-2S) protein [Bacillota bacterium]|nr:Rieske (2Fe-2S) protein [Bacillota bacterium]
MSLHRLARAEEIPPGAMRLFPLGRRGIGVFNVGGALHALNNLCPHAGGPLCLGEVTGTTLAGAAPYALQWIRPGEILRCPWHAWEVDITTGRTVTDPARSVATYPVRVEDGWIVVEVED